MSKSGLCVGELIRRLGRFAPETPVRLSVDTSEQPATLVIAGEDEEMVSGEDTAGRHPLRSFVTAVIL